MNNYLQAKTPPSSSTPALNIAVVGARGYLGLELVRILQRHPAVRSLFVTAREAFNLETYLYKPSANLKSIEDLIRMSENSELDLVFLATPPETSAELAPLFLKNRSQVIDLSGAFRLKGNNEKSRQNLYQAFYKMPAGDAKLAEQSLYGLRPFFDSSSLIDSNAMNENRPTVLIANPGCYPTATLMALLPLFKSEILSSENIVIDAKSGTTGAGKKAQESLLFSEVESECRPYKIEEHQHGPEIEEMLMRFSKTQCSPFFTTHLLNIRRGILVSIYANLNKNKYPSSSSSIEALDVESIAKSSADSDLEMENKILKAYEDFYHDYPFVEFGQIDKKPHLLHLRRVVGTPRVQIAFKVKASKVYLFSMIDNLLKGAASQAIENLNWLYQLPLNTGLDYLEGAV